MDAYDVGEVLPVDGIPPGTQLLVSSPPMLGGRTLLTRLLAGALDRGDACLVVSTDRDARRVAADLDEQTTARDAASRLGVVDCTGEEAAADPAVAHAVSPADLTGIAMGVSELGDRLGSRADRLWVALDSLSTLLVYSDLESVFRFVHTLTGRVQDTGACSLLSIQTDTDQQATESFRSLVDGAVELRERDRTTEVRVRGVGNASGEWHAFDPGESTAWRDDAGAVPASDAVAPVDSLHALVERMADEALTLTVLNHTGDALDDLTAYFDRLSVETRTVALPTDDPTDLAVLHRGPETLATNHVTTLADWVRLDDPEDGDEAVARATDLTRPEVVERASRDEYTVANAGKLQMVRISRLIELRALDAGGGTLYTGFQRLDRIDDELATRRLYERLAATGVDVHVYGAPGDVPNADAYTLHAGTGAELVDSWFVVYDGPPSQAGALVSEETAPGRYSGFWTYRPDVTRATADYLDATY